MPLSDKMFPKCLEGLISNRSPFQDWHMAHITRWISPVYVAGSSEIVGLLATYTGKFLCMDLHFLERRKMSEKFWRKFLLSVNHAQIGSRYYHSSYLTVLLTQGS